MSIPKITITLVIIFLYNAGVCSQTTINYARYNAITTLEISWNANNYGTIQWQRSTDNGVNWVDISNETKPVYEFRPTTNGLYRAKIDTQKECEPTYITQEVRVVNFGVDLLSVSEKSAEFEVTNADFGEAQIVEYGFSYNLSELNSRNFQYMYKAKAGTSIPSQNRFSIVCTDLKPGTTYSIRVYFKTADGSVIYGPGRIAKTLPGIKWTSEGWQITKTTIQARFEMADYNSTLGNPNVIFKLGTTPSNLQTYAVEDLGSFRYKSTLISNLNPNTTYILQAEATVEGEKQIVSKEIKTLPDYSNVVVDNTTNGVKHTIRWDATKTLNRISPVGLLTEYPRVIRISEDTLLCTYHGGITDYWVNIYIQKSFDNGRTWTSPAILVDKENSTIGNRYWRFANPEMVRLKNGWILMSFIGNGKPETNDNCHVMVMLSKDNGETWDDPRIIGRGRTWEPMVVQLPNGELELLVASEAAWWGGAAGSLPQEIMYSRSTDNGETWTELKRASYSPDRRDGMPVAVVMQGNKGIIYAIEIVNDGGFGSPSVVRRGLNEEWDPTPWNGVAYNRRWNVNINGHGGAPYVIQLPTGEIVLTAHTGGRNGIWQTSYPRVTVGDSNGKNFITPITPLTNLPANEGAYYNSLFLKDNETVWLLVTNSWFENGVRIRSEIKYLEGKIVERN